MGPNREITVDTWVGEGQDIILFEEEPSDNILMDIQFRSVMYFFTYHVQPTGYSSVVVVVG